jgi:aspartate kinase
VIVLKFGGTSVKDQSAIEQLVEIVRKPAPRAVVVVSALAGVTDQLLGVAECAAAGDSAQALASIENIRLRHHSVSVVVSDAERRRAVLVQIDREFRGLSEIVAALATLRDTSPRWRDAIAATGELVSSRLVAAALTARGVPADWVDARTAVVTNDEFCGAAPDMDLTTAATRRVCEPILAAGRVPVLGGFVGATANGITTTLGRGGSDFSGAIIGAALDADEIQIWTDVDGMLTADPRIISDAQVVPHLSFAEASELAHFGAKVLHPATILPAVAKNIPVRILNSKRPSAVGTLITGERAESAPAHGVTAIASKAGITVLNITSTRMVMAHGFLRKLFEVFERQKTAVDVVTTSEASVSVTVDDERRLPMIVDALSEFAEVSSENDMAIVCLVGDALPSNAAAAGEILTALNGVPLRMVSQAASRRNVTIVLRAEDLRTALGRLHERFVTAGVANR